MIVTMIVMNLYLMNEYILLVFDFFFLTDWISSDSSVVPNYRFRRTQSDGRINWTDVHFNCLADLTGPRKDSPTSCRYVAPAPAPLTRKFLKRTEVLGTNGGKCWSSALWRIYLILLASVQSSEVVFVGSLRLGGAPWADGWSGGAVDIVGGSVGCIVLGGGVDAVEE